MRNLLIAVLAVSLCGCIIYKLPTRQGNVIDQEEIDKLELGMTRDQVKFVMGTPIAASTMQTDRWDYLGYYKDPRGKTYTRTVSLYFEGEKLARMDGAAGKKDESDPGNIEAEAKAKSEADKKLRDEENEAGIVVRPSPNP